MHGRIKVKSTAEQLERKRKEQQKKLAMFMAGKEKAFEKRIAGEFDAEALEVTGKLLSVNPDFYSLWNIRRETLLHLKEACERNEIDQTVQNELSFLEGCLRVNPKSYGSWFHRGWVVDVLADQPNWEKELNLCNLYLEYDERNFHCWDYRRFVVEKSAVPGEEELKFTTEKISNNFSNFSSWHYRSKLLPQLRPDNTQPSGIKEDSLLEELELVQNAFFTDPNDQSAWFYHRWLLGANDSTVNLYSVYASVSQDRMYATLSKTVKLGVDCDLVLTVNDEAFRNVKWTSLTDSQYDNVWYTELSPYQSGDHDTRIHVNILDKSPLSCVLQHSDCEAYASDHGIITNFSTNYSPATKSTLAQELDSCQQLHELEPENKWTMLTILSLMRTLNSVAHHKAIMNYLSKLVEVDPMRCNYYKDLESRIQIEHAINTQDHCYSSDLDLHSKSITQVYHVDRLSHLRVLNIADNAIKSLPSLTSMQRLKQLNLANNDLCDVQCLQHANNLEMLDLSHNKISTVKSLEPLQKCICLTSLTLQGNPLCDENGWKATVQTVLPNVELL